MAMLDMGTRSDRPLYPPKPAGWRGRKDLITGIVVFALIFLLPWVPLFSWTGIFDSTNSFGQGNLAFVYVYAAAAIGFNLLIGYSGALGLAHAGIFGLGAYGTAILSAPTEESGAREAVAGYGWPFFVALPVVCIFAVIIGVAVGFPAARLKGFFLAIATLALGELILTIIRLDDDIWSGLKTNGGTGKQVPQFAFWDASRTLSAYMMAAGALLIVFVAYVILTERRLGRTLKVIRDTEIAAGPIGISATYYKLVAFGLSSFAAALAGAAWAQNAAFVNPASFRTRLLIFLLVVLIVGGLGRLWGPLIGAVFFVYLRQELQDTQKFLFLFLGITLMLMILVLPQGIASLPQRFRDSRWVKDLERRLRTLEVRQ